jgi:ligand-binding sensor domain-containing protein
VGTDDGLVQRTLDGGATWTDVTATLPRKWVSRVVISKHPARVYATMTGYREDDFQAYAFRSDDHGKSWRSIADGLPTESINVIREDPNNTDLLYVGTDRGVHASLDGGRSWHSLRGNLPTTPVHDLAVHRGGDLIIGTHGRGVFVLPRADMQLGAR